MPNVSKIQELKIDSLSYALTPKENSKDKIDVEIGDSKDLTQFRPQVKVMRWDNEVNFSARLVSDEDADEVISQDEDKIVWENGSLSANFYDIPEDEKLPEGGQEFEVILKEKPKTNQVKFTLNTKGLDFFYQPELTQEEKDQGASRPENVVGSYAVYASENKANYVGGKEYKCGKVGHIYRPRIEDAEGNWVWGELHIDTQKGLLTVAIPQEFLDNAVYPVRHAAGLTFGYTTTGATLETGAYKNRIAGWKFTAPENGTINSISIQTYILDTEQIKGAIYDTSGNLVGTGGSPESSSYWAWHVSNISSGNPNIVSGTEYVIVGWSNSAYGNAKYDGDYTTPYKGRYLASTYGNWPSSASFTAYWNKYSIYATYTATASSAIKTVNGLAKASVKTVNGLAIASVKTRNGLA